MKAKQSVLLLAVITLFAFIDYYGRPWAQNWEKYFEVGWDKPDDGISAEILDLFK